MDYLLSRHPIFKSGIHLSGYEIRSRAVGANAISESAEFETESAMFAMLSEAGLEQIGGTYPCVIGVTPENLISERECRQGNLLFHGASLRR